MEMSDRRHLPVLGALAAGSVLSLAILAGRIVATGRLTHLHLVWNLFLAWIPLVAALASRAVASRSSRPARCALLASGSLWLLFFPNAPYLLTDLIHLRQRPGAPLWFDLLLLLAFAWAGYLLGLVSLLYMHGTVRGLFGRTAGWACIALATVAAGFGIYLGRFGRWNSWDAFTRPADLVSSIVVRFADPTSHPRFLAFSALSSALIAVGYLTLVAVAPLVVDREAATSKPGA